MTRPLRALWRISLLTAMQYRADFLLGAVMSVFWTLWMVAPLVLVFEHTQAVEGFSYPQALLVMSFFLFLRGLLDLCIEPNLRQLVTQIRDGSLDFVLLKPADAQVMVSFARIVPAKVADLLFATGLAVWCLVRLGRVPSALEVAGALLCLVSGACVLYSIWLAAAASAFWWVKVDSLSYLLGALLDAGRWPGVVYRGWVSVVLTFVLPITLMTSYPAMALLGLLEPAHAAWAAAAAVLFLAGSRALWRFAVGHYVSC